MVPDELAWVPCHRRSIDSDPPGATGTTTRPNHLPEYQYRMMSSKLEPQTKF